MWHNNGADFELYTALLDNLGVDPGGEDGDNDGSGDVAKMSKLGDA